MWDEEDGFYYDVLRLPDGSATRLKVRSMVGLLPLVRDHCHRALAARAGAATGRRSCANACDGCRNCSTAFIPPGRAISGMASAALLALVNRGPAAPDPDAHARRERIPESLWHSGALPLPRRASLCLQCAVARNTA